MSADEEKPKQSLGDSVSPPAAEFELGEDVSQQRNRDRELAWSDVQTEGREQLSARETMIKYGANLQTAISAYHFIVEDLLPILERKLSLGLCRKITDFLFHDSGRLMTFGNMIRNRDAAHFEDLIAGSDGSFQVCVRVRPLFAHERADGEYSAVRCQPLHRRQVTVHEGSLDRSGRRMEMVHHNVMVHKLWDHTSSNDVVSKEVIDPLIDFVETGKAATVIMYGQTGTGKTYTLNGLFQRLCHLLKGRLAEVTFVEIDGKKVFDLLNNHERVKLLADSDGNVHVKGAARKPLPVVPPSASEAEKQRLKQAAVKQALAKRPAETAGEIIPELSEESSSDDMESDGEGETTSVPQTAAVPTKEPKSRAADDLYSTLMRALEERTQLVTERNPVSSRTHAVCQIRIIPKADEDTAGSHTTSCSNSAHTLTLVDLAGSERKYETMHMSVEEHKRSADINYTLMTLRHVFRTYNARTAMNNSEANGGESAAGGLPSTRRAGPAELRRMTTKKMTKAREKLRRQADQIVLASHFRGSLLTRILRASFTSTAEQHRTKIIATVSPAATDVYHTLNTLSQVTLMSPFLEQMVLQMEVEVLMASQKSLLKLPVNKWGAEEIGIWLRTAQHGRFAELALPPSITGAQLLQLSQASLAELFGQEGRVARTAGEGESWVITNESGTRRDHYSNGPRDWGRAIYRSLMKYQAKYEAAQQGGLVPVSDLASSSEDEEEKDVAGGGGTKSD